MYLCTRTLQPNPLNLCTRTLAPTSPTPLKLPCLHCPSKSARGGPDRDGSAPTSRRAGRAHPRPRHCRVCCVGGHRGRRRAKDKRPGQFQVWFTRRAVRGEGRRPWVPMAGPKGAERAADGSDMDRLRMPPSLLLLVHILVAKD